MPNLDREDIWRVIDLLLCGLEPDQVRDHHPELEPETIDAIWAAYLEDPEPVDSIIERQLPTYGASRSAIAQIKRYDRGD